MHYLSAHISLLQRSKLSPSMSPWQIQQTRWNIGKPSTAQIESCACIRSYIPIGGTLAHKSYSSNNLIWVISLVQSYKQANRPAEVWTEHIHCCTWYKNIPLTEYQRHSIPTAVTDYNWPDVTLLFLLRSVGILGNVLIQLTNSILLKLIIQIKVPFKEKFLWRTWLQ